jgi:hypothetical protein
MESEALSGFREIVRQVHDLDALTPMARQASPLAREVYEGEDSEPSPDSNESYWFEFDSTPEGDLEGSCATVDERLRALPQRARRARGTGPEAGRTRRSFSYGFLAALLIALMVVVGSAATVFWKWPAITELYVFLDHTESKPQSQASHLTTSAQLKLAGVPEQQSSVETPWTILPSGQTAALQSVMLYEENPSEPRGKSYTGSAVWHTETVSPGPGFAPELAVRADAVIPERSMAVTWALRRNADKAAYTIETTFHLPANGGGIANVPGILMKQSEQARGTPLAGLAVKVTNGFFVVGLSTDDTSAQHNAQLLKEFSWLDIPIVYTNGGRAILAIEKGPPGDRAFAQAFAAWGSK